MCESKISPKDTVYIFEDSALFRMFSKNKLFKCSSTMPYIVAIDFDIVLPKLRYFFKLLDSDTFFRSRVRLSSDSKTIT